jgi:hypothetical protein
MRNYDIWIPSCVAKIFLHLGRDYVAGRHRETPQLYRDIFIATPAVENVFAAFRLKTKKSAVFLRRTYSVLAVFRAVDVGRIAAKRIFGWQTKISGKVRGAVLVPPRIALFLPGLCGPIVGT